jgi:hypothetical protein
MTPPDDVPPNVTDEGTAEGTRLLTPVGSKAMLKWGSLIRLWGAIMVGVALIVLGVWVTNPASSLRTLGLIISMVGVGTILAGVGSTMQSWGRAS